MPDIIYDEIIAELEVLAKLTLSEKEKNCFKKDMGQMLGYLDQLGDLGGSDIEPISYVLPVKNVFREDRIINREDRINVLKNAPQSQGNAFQVPKTVE